MAEQATQRRPKRRWHEAPVITRGPETLDGGRILDEVEGALGLLLWQLLRDVVLWAASDAAERPRLFWRDARQQLTRLESRANFNGLLTHPIGRLVALVGDPAGTAQPDVAVACASVAEWAEWQGRHATALEFAQAAALAHPGDASAAVRVGQLARHLGEHARAETWLRRAITSARRAKDWVPYAVALLELGRLYRERGYRRAARRFFVRALRVSVRRGDTATRAAAKHALRELA